MTIDPHDWEPQEPTHGFADRVLAEIARETRVAPTPRRMRGVRILAGAGLAFAAGSAIAVGMHALHTPDRGDVVAAKRIEVHLGDRAIAVLERGAHVSWNGDGVSQPAGDVFYRVEPGRAFDVHTPSGDVEVLGTCFQVKVDDAPRVETKEEPGMNGREVKAGVIGAALSAATFVSVYEGKVALSHENQRVTLTAGESARSTGAGVARTSRGAHGAAADDDTAAGASSSENDSLAAANANLADSVRDYKRRLEALDAQKTSLAKDLKQAQEKLAAAQNDGQTPPKKSEFDLTQDDWKELAQQGKVVSRTPCADPAAWTPTPAQLAKVGLAPSDAQPIHDARATAYERVWSVIRPLCVQALQGDAKVADRLGPVTCTSLVGDIAQANGENTEEELRAVAEMRAGMQPYDPKALGTYGQILYAQSGEPQGMLQQLSQSIGPADAHAFVFDSEGCWSNSASQVGPRPVLPPTK